MEMEIAVVSDFIIKSCTVHPQPNDSRFIAIRRLISECLDHHGNDCTNIVVRTQSGSASEFFIEPMLPCIGDIDIMFYTSDKLVVPEGHHVTDYVHLPVEFHTSDEINLYEFVDTEYPGYVFQRLIGKLIKSGNSGEYKFVRATVRFDYTTITFLDKTVRHGPAKKIEKGSMTKVETDGKRYEDILSADSVRCWRCLEWPPQAAEWSTRSRNHGCPDTATLERVVNNGCDLVFTAHRQCKHDEWFNERMKRISLSRAETTLLNTWTSKQQIVYHVLRYVIKKMDFIESEQSTCGIFSNYHLKTLMLWSCERHPQQRWTSSLVHITSELLHDLANLLASGECPQYFITKCNLFDYFNEFNSTRLESAFSRLSSLTVDDLFVLLTTTYVLECAHLCPEYISQLMYDMNTVTQLHYALSSIVEWRLKCVEQQSLKQFNTILSCSEVDILYTRLTQLPVYRQFIESMREVDGRVIDFIIALMFLHFTELMKQGQSIFEIVNVIHELMQCPESNISLQTKSRLSSTNTPFRKATNILMKLNTEVDINAMLQIELAKAFFHLSIDNTDVYQVHMHYLTRVYLASLYYSTEQYQTAIDQLLLVTKSFKTECSSLVVETQLLQDNDNDIPIVSGLIVLYQYLTQRTSSCQQSRQTCIFSANLCSMFYMVKCDRQLKDKSGISQEYQENVKQSEHLFIGDILLIYFVRSSKVSLYFRRSKCNKIDLRSEPIVFNTFRLRCLLMKSSVERLTAVRHVMSRDYASVFTSVISISMVTSDYEAMYAYKCGEYDYCLRLCLENVNSLHDSTYATCSFSWPSDLLHLMDDVCLSLVGLCILGRLYDYDADDAYQNEDVSVSQMSLSLYLLVQCKLKLKHSSKSFLDVLRVINRECLHTSVDWVTDRLLLAIAFRRTTQLFYC